MRPVIIAVVVLSYNAREATRRCLRSVMRSNYPELEIVLVDNASTDGTVEQVRAEFPGIHVSTAPTNLGFGGGNNIGIEVAAGLGAGYVFFLNDDARVEPDTISALSDFLIQHRECGAVAPVVVQTATGRILYAGARFNRHLIYGRNLFWLDPISSFTRTEPIDADYCDFAAALVRLPALRMVGSFDPSFFLYNEGIDLSLRLRAKGWKIQCLPRSRVYHDSQASIDPKKGADLRLSPQAFYFYTRGYVILARKLYGTLRAVVPIALNCFFVLPYYFLTKSRPSERTQFLIQAARGYKSGLLDIPRRNS
jgi:GT2 family glycosyltransferase